MTFEPIPAISVEEVGKVFSPAPPWLKLLIKSPLKEHIRALDSVSFELAQGEVCALVGPNGAGKTTLFKILVGLTTPTTGRATVLGSDVVSQSLAVRKRIGWMPTSGETVFSRHSVAENLRFQGRVFGYSGADLIEAVDRTLDIVGLGHVRDNAALSLSSGMLSRLQLGRALLHRPRLLILDEPTASVDPVGALALMDLVVSIVQEHNMAAIISSHRLDEIEELGARVLLLHRGSVLYDGNLDGLAKRGQARFQIDFSSEQAARFALRAMEASGAVAAGELTGRSVELLLDSGERLGPVLGAIDAQLPEVLATRRIDAPLRSVLASVYREADEKARLDE